MLRLSDKGDHGSVVIGVQMAIEHGGAFDRFDRPRNAFDGLTLAAFTEVWYTLNQAIFDL